MIRLAKSTRRDNVLTFRAFASVDEVPLHSVSVGLGTIAASRSARLVLHGADKREAAARLLALEDFDPTWPASIVYACADGELWIDREALGR